jgi:hypothetical protein
MSADRANYPTCSAELDVVAHVIELRVARILYAPTRTGLRAKRPAGSRRTTAAVHRPPICADIDGEGEHSAQEIIRSEFVIK